MLNLHRPSITIVAAALLLATAPARALEGDPIPFAAGDDSGRWANDGECDDPRYHGSGMAALPDVGSIGRDATDCNVAFASGEIDANDLFADPAHPRDIVWGDDASDFAHDGECDDMRFAGYALADSPGFADIGHDASDCRALFVRGLVRWRGLPASD